MFFGFIFLRILFIACMVFILGYVFGPFSKKLVLRRITRVAAVLVIVLFFLSNMLTMRAAWSGHFQDRRHALQERGWCGQHNHEKDSTVIEPKP